MLMDPRVGGKKAERVENMNDHELLQFVVNQLTATLLSHTCEVSKKGFLSATKLAECFQSDTGLYVHEVAQRFGFGNFEIFVKSTEMKKYIAISLLPDGRTFFSAKIDKEWNNEKLSFLLEDKHNSAETAAFKNNRDANEKYARAMLPENQGQLLEGRMQLVQVVYLCGGEVGQVSVQQLRDKYAQKYGMELNKEVLKNYFRREKFTHIILDYCHNEIELLTSDDDSVFFLKLKKPYKEIQENFADLLDQQRNPPASTGNFFSSGRRSIPRPKEMFGERRALNIAPVLPRVNPDLFSDDEFDAFEEPSSEAESVSKANKFNSSNANSEQQISENWKGSSPAVYTTTEPAASMPSSRSMLTLREKNTEESPLKNFSMTHTKWPEPREEQNLWEDLDESEDDPESEQEDYDDPILVDVSPEQLLPIVTLNNSSRNSQKVAENQQQSCPSHKEAVLIDFWKDEDIQPENQEGSPVQSLPSGSPEWVFLPFQPNSRSNHENNQVKQTGHNPSPVSSSTLSPLDPVVNERVDGLAALVVAIVKYRSMSQKTTKLEVVVRALLKLHPGCETGIEAAAVLEFIKEYCKELKILMHEGETVLCWCA